MQYYTACNYTAWDILVLRITRCLSEIQIWFGLRHLYLLYLATLSKCGLTHTQPLSVLTCARGAPPTKREQQSAPFLEEKDSRERKTLGLTEQIFPKTLLLLSVRKDVKVTLTLSSS